MLKRANITVYGQVQGVFYRSNTCQKARELNIVGWVRNEPDGSVKIIAEGEFDNLKRLIKWCHKGPRGAITEKVEVEWEEAKGEFRDFEIRYEQILK